MLILQVTCQIQNPRQEDFCVFSEATRLFQLGGPVRDRLLYLTVVLKQKSFLWALVCVSMEFLRRAWVTPLSMF